MTIIDPHRIKCFMVNVDRNGHFKYGNDDRWKSIEHDLPPGGMYFADWCKRKGPDGRHLIIRTPGGFWHPDNRARDCTRPDESWHRCWIRHGTPPLVTIDKQGNTCFCSHSIILENYQGFLTDGFLVAC